MDSQLEQPAKEPLGPPPAPARKAYVPPTLTDFGSLTELTRGTFAGTGADSGVYS
jgi:hypothetical protein